MEEALARESRPSHTCDMNLRCSICRLSVLLLLEGRWFYTFRGWQAVGSGWGGGGGEGGGGMGRF